MTTLIIDTNVIGRGQFDFEALHRLARAVEPPDVEFVIPEAVLWEWAEHASRAVRDLNKTYSTLRSKSLFEGELTLQPEPASELIGKMKASLPTGYRVWRPNVLELSQALQAQVLVEGAASVKGGVKTGAVDELVLKCVAGIVAKPDPHRPVVLVTNDKALKRECERRFPEVQYARSERDILTMVLHFEGPPPDFEPWIYQAVEAAVADDTTEFGQSLRQFRTGYNMSWTSSQHSGMQQLVDFEIDKVAVRDLRVASWSGGHIIRCVLRMSGVASDEEYEMVQAAEDDWVAEVVSQLRRPVSVTAPVSAIVRHPPDVVDFALTDRASVEFTD